MAHKLALETTSPSPIVIIDTTNPYPIPANGELRLAQTALYAGGHHELGIVFVEQEHEWDSEAM